MGTKAELIKIEKGAVYQDSIWDYWLFFRLLDKSVVKVFDNNCFGDKLELNQTYHIKLSSCHFYTEQEDSKVQFTGIVAIFDNVKKFYNEFIQICLTDYQGLEDAEQNRYTFGRIDLDTVDELL